MEVFIINYRILFLGSLNESKIMDGICYKQSSGFSFAGTNLQPSILKNPKILLLNFEV
jgi:hypothetical protein